MVPRELHCGDLVHPRQGSQPPSALPPPGHLRLSSGRAEKGEGTLREGGEEEGPQKNANYEGGDIVSGTQLGEEKGEKWTVFHILPSGNLLVCVLC